MKNNIKEGRVFKRLVNWNSNTFILIFFSSICVPLALSSFMPLHDARLRYEIWIPSIRSFLISRDFPIWLPNIGEGGVAASIYNQMLDGTDYITVLLTAAFHLSPNIAFSVYVFLNNLLGSLTINRLSIYFNIDKVWNFGLISLWNFNPFAWWQPAWNLNGILKILIATLFTINLLEKTSLRNISLWIILNISFLPFGGTPYLSVYAYYLEIYIFIFWAFSNSFSYKTYLIRIKAKILNFRNTAKSMEVTNYITAAIFMSIITIWTFFLKFQYSTVKNDITILSIGRNMSGSQTFNDYIKYGGHSGFEKTSMMLGQMLDSQNIIYGSPDFFLSVAPFTLIMLIFAITRLKKSSYKEKLLFSIITILIAYSFPVEILARFAFYHLPGISLSRHITYTFAFVGPFITIFLGMYIFSVITSKNNSSLRTLQSIFYIQLLYVVMWLLYINHKYKSLSKSFDQIQMILIFYIILSCIGMLLLHKNGANVNVMEKRIRKFYIGVVLIYFGSALIYILGMFQIQIQSHHPQKDNYLNLYANNLASSLPITRIENETSNSQGNLWRLSGALYMTRNNFLNIDPCIVTERIDFISKSIFMNKEMINRSNSRCHREKVSIDYKNQSSDNVSAKLAKLLYNQATIEIQDVSKSETDQVIKLTYRDAYSKSKLFESIDEKGTEYEIQESQDGYKVIHITSETSTINFKIKSFYVNLLRAKVICDILLVLYLLIFLTSPASNRIN